MKLEPVGPLFRAVEEGRLKTLAALKNAWRRSALATHPDSRPDADPEAFRRLTADFEAARALLERRPGRVPPPALPDWVDLVCELVASGFPAPDRARRDNAAYRRRLALLDQLWADQGGDPEALADELDRLRNGGGAGPAERTGLQEFLHLAVAHHHHRFAYVRAQLDREGPKLAARLRLGGWDQTARLVEALVPPKGG